MKAVFKLWIAIALVAFAFTACNKTDETIDDSIEGTYVGINEGRWLIPYAQLSGFKNPLSGKKLKYYKSF